MSTPKLKTKIFSNTKRTVIAEEMDNFFAQNGMYNEQKIISITQSSASGETIDGIKVSVLDITVIYRETD